MKLSPRLVALSGAVAAGLIAAGTTAAVQAAPAHPVPNPAQARAAAVGAASSLVASRPGYLHASADDAFVQRPVISSEGIQYVPYERTYKGLPVVGGDFVVGDRRRPGEVTYTSVAQQQSIGELSTTPKLTAAAAERTARAQLRKVTGVEGTTLVVHALGARPALAWETTVTGTGADGPSRLTVDVDAVTGAVLGTQEHVVARHRHRRLERPGHPEHHPVGQHVLACKDPTVTNHELPGRREQHDVHRPGRRLGQRQRHQPGDRLRRRAVRRRRPSTRCCRSGWAATA